MRFAKKQSEFDYFLVILDISQSLVNSTSPMLPADQYWVEPQEL